MDFLLVESMKTATTTSFVALTKVSNRCDRVDLDQFVPVPKTDIFPMAKPAKVSFKYLFLLTLISSPINRHQIPSMCRPTAIRKCRGDSRS